jgi:hypothetical protein
VILKSYLQSLLEFIEICPVIENVDIIRHDYHINESEEILLYRLKVDFSDRSSLEIFERLVCINNYSERTKYSYQWQNSNNELLGRWDNAPHHPEISTHPHHHHSPGQTVESSELSGIEILEHIVNQY